MAFDIVGFAVFVACECSQTVCLAFRDIGVQAFSCDVSHSYGGHPEFHIVGDCLDYINGCCTFKNEYGEEFRRSEPWSIVIAHPPCTYLSLAGARYLYDGSGSIASYDRYEKGMKAAEFFYKCFYCNAPRVCVENPVPCRIFGLPNPSQIIQPYYFGDPYSKRTCLWLRNLFPLVADYVVKPEYSWCAVHKSARIRSKTFPGVAAAMAWTWGVIQGGIYHGS